MKLHPFTTTEPCHYAAQDDTKHLYFKDYKSLKNVQFVEDKINWIEVLTLLFAFASIILVLFLN
jgi:GH18 family chitinase